MAQSRQEVGTADGQQEIKPLQIGDTIPEALWHLPLQVVNHPDGKDAITLDDYRNEKLVILDFWATWCAPCISSLDKLNSLQQEFGHDLAVIPVTTQESAKILDFLNERKLVLPSVVEDSTIGLSFPHRFIPHQVWIKNGNVLAITNGKSATPQNIRTALQQDRINVKLKRDLLIDYRKPISDYIGNMDVPVLYRSFFSGRIEGVGNVGRTSDGKVKIIYFYNRPILSMYQTALLTPYSEFLLDVRDTAKFVSQKGVNDNIYCYQLIADKDEPDEKIKNKVLSDLNSNLGLRLSREVMDRECYILRSKMGNDTSAEVDHQQGITIESLLRSLNYAKSWHSKIIRFVDESGFKGMFPGEEFKGVSNATDINELGRLLAPYGLYIEKGKRALQYYVITEI